MLPPLLKKVRQTMAHMINPLNSTTVPILEKVVNFAQSRHNVLAGNLANVDTPGYEVRDLSLSTFRERLNNLIEARHSPYNEGEQEIRYDDAMQEVDESMRTILYRDKSDVGLEQQVLEVSKNQSLHNMAIAIMQNQIQMLNVAINERV